MSQITAAAGVACILAAVVALTNVWWALLLLGLVLLVSAWAQHSYAASAAAAPDRSSLRAVPDRKAS